MRFCSLLRCRWGAPRAPHQEGIAVALDIMRENCPQFMFKSDQDLEAPPLNCAAVGEGGLAHPSLAREAKWAKEWTDRKYPRVPQPPCPEIDEFLPEGYQQAGEHASAAVPMSNRAPARTRTLHVARTSRGAVGCAGGDRGSEVRPLASQDLLSDESERGLPRRQDHFATGRLSYCFLRKACPGASSQWVRGLCVLPWRGGGKRLARCEWLASEWCPTQAWQSAKWWAEVQKHGNPGFIQIETAKNMHHFAPKFGKDMLRRRAYRRASFSRRKRLATYTIHFAIDPYS